MSRSDLPQGTPPGKGICAQTCPLIPLSHAERSFQYLLPSDWNLILKTKHPQEVSVRLLLHSSQPRPSTHIWGHPLGHSPYTFGSIHPKAAGWCKEQSHYLGTPAISTDHQEYHNIWEHSVVPGKQSFTGVKTLYRPKPTASSPSGPSQQRWCSKGSIHMGSRIPGGVPSRSRPKVGMISVWDGFCGSEGKVGGLKFNGASSTDRQNPSSRARILSLLRICAPSQELTQRPGSESAERIGSEPAKRIGSGSAERIGSEPAKRVGSWSKADCSNPSCGSTSPELVPHRLQESKEFPESRKSPSKPSCSGR